MRIVNAMTPEDVFLAAGRALAQVHRFEHNLKGLAALVRSIETADEGEAITVDFSGFSLGPLVDHVRRLVHADPDLEATMERARVRRNALCHAYFQDHAAEMATAEGRRALVADLREDEALFAHVAAQTTDLLARLVTALDARLGDAS